jgi:hypothetical protein
MEWKRHPMQPAMSHLALPIPPAAPTSDAAGRVTVG